MSDIRVVTIESHILNVLPAGFMFDQVPVSVFWELVQPGELRGAWIGIPANLKEWILNRVLPWIDNSVDPPLFEGVPILTSESMPENLIVVVIDQEHPDLSDRLQTLLVDGLVDGAKRIIDRMEDGDGQGKLF